MKPEIYSNKLYILKDAEGNSNREVFAKIRQLENEFSKNENFVAIAPFGSSVSGYNIKNDSSSDLDYLVLLDSSIENSEGYKSAEEIKKNFNFSWTKSNFFDYKIHITPRVFDMNVVLQRISQMKDKGLVGITIPTIMADMSLVFTGKKIDEYRKKISDEIKTLSIEAKKDLIRLIIKVLMEQENVSIEKKKKRISDLSDEEHQDIMNSRKEMWRKRIKQIWNLQITF